MNPFDQLAEKFAALPGVGPRQARRMVFFLLRQRREWTENLTALMRSLRAQAAICEDCRRFFLPDRTGQTHCRICADPHRPDHTLIIVEKEVDLENIEQSGAVEGKYFVLGGLYAPLAKEPARALRLAELDALLQRRAPALREVIIALAVNPDGEETRRFLTEHLASAARRYGFSLTAPARGLSTGSELEYADPQTLRSAFAGRSAGENIPSSDATPSPSAPRQRAA